MLTPLIQILAAFGLPLLFIRLSQREVLPQWLSPIVLAYVAGILLANIPGFPLQNSISSTLTDITIPLAIPLLLFNTDLPAWLKNARPAIISFALCLVAVSISSVLAALFFAGMVEDAATASGMLVGVYTGGSPNLAAIGKALQSSEEMFILLNASEIICSGIYLVFLTSIAQRVLLYFLPSFKKKNPDNSFDNVNDKEHINLNKKYYSEMLIGLAFAAVVFAASAGISFLIAGAIDLVTVLISLTTLSIIFSFFPRIRNLSGSFDLGQYLLLVFSVAIGMMTNFSELLQDTPVLLFYTAVVMTGAILIHYFLAAIFRIDADTVLITSTAAIFGPVFVGQVAVALKNKEVVFSGIITGLVGYAAGNYLGITIAYFIKNWIE